MTPTPEEKAPAAPPTSITPIPHIAPEPVGFSDPAPGGGYGPPSSGRGGKRALLPILLGAGALVVVGVVVLVIVLSGGSGGGDNPPAADPAGSSSSSSSSSSGSSSSSSSASSSDEDTLRSRIPAGFTADNCATIAPAGDGDLAALDCGGSTAQPGPDFSRFYLYPDTGTLEKVFLHDMTGVDLTELVAGQSCPDNQGYYFYKSTKDEQAGRVACYVSSDSNAAVLVWTQDDAGAEAVVQITGGGTDGLATLWNWWRDGANSDFRA